MNAALICRILVDISSYPYELFAGNFFIIDSVSPEGNISKNDIIKFKFMFF
jgi:hypothetical protein